MKIQKLKAIEVLDSRGKPTLRTFLTLEDGSVHKASVPSGASTGSHEAVELRDNDPARFFGQGVLNAINNVNGPISDAVTGMDAEKPEEIDRKMIALDGTADKATLGANAILSVSMAVQRAAAHTANIPLWKFINGHYFKETKPSAPKLMVNVINGGKHANWTFDIQEFIIIPSRQLASESVKMASEIYHSILKTLKVNKLSISVGDEGGFTPSLSSNEEVFRIIIESAASIGYENGKDFRLGIDAAASEFFAAGKYVLKKDSREISGDELIEYYLNLSEKYRVFSFEDVFHEDDWENWTKFKAKLDPNKQVVGDDLFCTDTKRMEIGQEKKAANALIIKPNQIGSIVETAAAINLAKKYNWAVAVSHRSGETEDPFIADLAYGAGADFIKTGSMSRSERLAKYNRLIEIENGL